MDLYGVSVNEALLVKRDQAQVSRFLAGKGFDKSFLISGAVVGHQAEPTAANSVIQEIKLHKARAS
jgi:hypothetical protein